MLKGLEARRLHVSGLREGAYPLDIDGAPSTARLSRREANGVAGLVNALAETIDPAKTECLIHSFRPGDAGLAGSSLMEADPEFLRILVMLFQPAAET